MADAPEKRYHSLLEAAAFAARTHEGQKRKDGETPYVSHVFRVCLVLRHVFGIDDNDALAAALLHDTVEDTKTDFDDIEEHFGGTVAEWVAALSKDKRLPEPKREQAYVEQLQAGSWQVRVSKLADVFDNLVDSVHTKPEQRAKMYQNAHRYLDAISQDLPEQARQPWRMVHDLLANLESGNATE